MKVHLQKYWFTYLLAAVAIFLLILLLSGNKPIDSHASEAAALKKENAELSDRISREQKVHDSLHAEIRQKDSAVAALRVQQKVTANELVKTKGKVQNLADEVKELSRLDTTYLARKADSLQQYTRDLIMLNDAYVEFTDSLNSLVDRNKADYERLISDKDKLFNQVNAARERCAEDYAGLKKDYDKLGKKLKRNKLLTKVTAVLAGALAVIAAVK
jgi:chromosome segregation ATPase